MYKISVFLILLIMGLILKKVDAMVQSQAAVTAQAPATVAPVVVEAKPQEPASFEKRTKHQLTSEEFKKRVEKKVRYLKTLENKLMKDKVEADEKVWFDLHARCAAKWVETLEKYESTDTQIHRSGSWASKESYAAKKLTTIRPTHHQVKAVYPEKDIERLEKRFNEAKVHADKLDGDNRKAFDAMIYCIGEYIEALKGTKEKPIPVSRLLRQAMDYLNTAEAFLHKRVHKPQNN